MTAGDTIATLLGSLPQNVPALDLTETPPASVEPPEQKVEITSDPLKPWFKIDGDPPYIVGRWISGKWEVEVINNPINPLNMRQRNLFHVAVTQALRRQQRKAAFEHQKKQHKTQAQKQEEINTAIAEAKARGTYVGA